VSLLATGVLSVMSVLLCTWHYFTGSTTSVAWYYHVWPWYYHMWLGTTTCTSLPPHNLSLLYRHLTDLLAKVRSVLTYCVYDDVFCVLCRRAQHTTHRPRAYRGPGMYLYVLLNLEGKMYVGCSRHPDRRLVTHNSTAKGLPGTIRTETVHGGWSQWSKDLPPGNRPSVPST
jgi:hypothetical protein